MDLKHCTNNRLQTTSDLPCIYSSQSFTLGRCLPNPTDNRRNRPKGTSQEGKIPNLSPRLPATTHLHLLLRLLPVHSIRSLSGPSSLTLEGLDLLVEKSPRLF